MDIFLTRRLSKSLAFCEFASVNFEPWAITIGKFATYSLGYYLVHRLIKLIDLGIDPVRTNSFIYDQKRYLSVYEFVDSWEVYRFRSVDGKEAVNTYVGHNFTLLSQVLNSVSFFSFQNATIVNAKERPYYLAAHV